MPGGDLMLFVIMKKIFFLWQIFIQIFTYITNFSCKIRWYCHCGFFIMKTTRKMMIFLSLRKLFFRSDNMKLFWGLQCSIMASESWFSCRYENIFYNVTITITVITSRQRLYSRKEGISKLIPPSLWSLVRTCHKQVRSLLCYQMLERKFLCQGEIWCYLSLWKKFSYYDKFSSKYLHILPI